MYTPDHWCNIPQNYSDILGFSNQTVLHELLIPIDENDMKRSQCLMYDPESINESPENKSKWQTIKCLHGWQYNFTGYFRSITTQVNSLLL